MAVATSSVTGFGLQLLAQLGPGPVAFSPASIHNALATFRQGASGRTREALDEVLGADAPGLDVTDPAIRLAIAQALWLDREYRLAPAFAEAAARRGVDCRALDFADPGAPAQVNAWAGGRTDGMIREVVGAFEEDEVLALADAVYFEGSWTQPFDVEETEERPFTRRDGTEVTVPAMQRHGRMDHYADDEIDAVRLPYGDGELAFVAVLAREGLEAPDPAAWPRIAFEHRPGRLALPRLELSSDLRLEPALRALGLGAMFDEPADLDGMFEGPAPRKSAARVLHKARVDLDEEGTRAAAVTVVTVVATSAELNPPEPFDLRLDRPFLWAIEHRDSGTLLFLGRVTDPSTS
jgi:serine protease inhibitor